MKILVTIGSMSEKKFTRLFKAMDALCEKGIVNGEDIVAQVGFDKYNSQYYKCFDMVSDDEFKNLIAESDLIISHAGTGTVVSCLKRGKKVIIFPRLKQYDEHYDDHQLELAKVFTHNNYVLEAKSEEELSECIARVKSFNPTPFVSNNKKMNELILEFIEK